MKSRLPILLIGLLVMFNFVNLKAQNAAVSLNNDGNPIVFTAIGDSCNGAGSEQHDNGTFENGYGWNTTVTDGRFVIKFDPTTYPWKYTKFCIALTRLAAGADSMKFDIVIYDTTGTSGGPGAVLGTLANQVARPILVYPAYSWFAYDISAVAGNTLTSGSVFIGIKYDASVPSNASKFVMADENGVLWPGYAYANTTWNTVQGWGGAFVNYKCLGMRTLGQQSGGCTYQWASQTSGTTTLLYSVSAVSNMVGWAGGASGTVRRTTDGGTTWGNGNPNPGVISGDIYNIYAWSANDAICTTSPGGTYIYKTSNGGTNWTQVYFLAGTAAFLDGLQMISATEGYGLGDPVAAKWMVVKTTDGGNTWARMATEPTPIGSEAGWNNSFLIVGTHMWFGTSGTRVYHSPDLGLTWSNAATTGVANTFAVHYNTTSNGLAGGSGTVMVKSVDGGTTYTSTGIPGTVGSVNGIEGNGTDWWATRTGTDIYRSTNQGANWTSSYTLAGATFSDIDFTLFNGCPVGWAVSQNGAIAKMSLVTGISNYNTEVPAEYNLSQNYPNPFNPSTNIKFSIPKSGLVTLKIYDMLGKEVASLVNEFKNAGNYLVGFNASNLATGTYVYRIEAADFVETKKMLLVK